VKISPDLALEGKRFKEELLDAAVHLGIFALRRIDIQVMPAGKRWFSALSVLTYFKYAPLRFSKTSVFNSA
jgi:hypothetical protein